MKTISSSILVNRKNESAQGFVEFALAVPILLLVLYGLLEVGRLLFIYSSTVTAARQAVRYGAVTGVNEDGIPSYRDCAGIRAAAQGVGFITEFDDIEISYDAGINDDTHEPYPPDAWCVGDYLEIEPESGHRLVVSVSATFAPVVPLVPLDPITIRSSSARTILRDINIEISAEEGGGGEDHGIHVVVEGDTLISIAQDYGIAVEQLMDANGLVDQNIYVGQILIIPYGEWVPTNTPTKTATPTATATFTSTPTPKKSPTPTYTPTITLTPTITYTPTITFTPSKTSTPTNTFTPSATPTVTYTPSPTSTPIECYVSHNGLSVTQNKMLLTVHNDSEYPITISNMTIFYDSTSPTGQGLTAVYAGGTLIWDDFKSGSPVTISNFIVDEPIDPLSSVALKLFFEKNIRITGMENIMISFVENGCPVHETAP